MDAEETGYEHVECIHDPPDRYLWRDVNTVSVNRKPSTGGTENV
jgi:hypothetical protein